MQTAALALSAVPLFLYARDRLSNDWLALTFGVAWLLNPTVQWLCWEAWHPETMAIPFLLMTWLMASRRRHGWYWVFLIAAVTWKEDIALAVIGLGIVLIVRRQRRLGLLTIAVGAIWFLVAYGIVMPAFNGGTNHAGIFYGELGDSPADLIKTTFTDPAMVLDRLDNNDALGYARDLLAPFAFTSLLAPLVLVPAIPQFFANILTNLNFFWSIQFHYAAIIVTFVALASVDGVARLKGDSLRRFGVGAVAAAALATSVAWGMSPISTQYRNGYWPLAENPRQAILDAGVDSVPGDAAVAATYNIVPHLSHREQIYTFPNPWFPLNWGVAGVAPTIRTTTTYLPRSTGSSSIGRRTSRKDARSNSSTASSTAASSKSSPTRTASSSPAARRTACRRIQVVRLIDVAQAGGASGLTPGQFGGSGSPSGPGFTRRATMTLSCSKMTSNSPSWAINESMKAGVLRVERPCPPKVGHVEGEVLDLRGARELARSRCHPYPNTPARTGSASRTTRVDARGAARC